MSSILPKTDRRSQWNLQTPVEICTSLSISFSISCKIVVKYFLVSPSTKFCVVWLTICIIASFKGWSETPITALWFSATLLSFLPSPCFKDNTASWFLSPSALKSNLYNSVEVFWNRENIARIWRVISVRFFWYGLPLKIWRASCKFRIPSSVLPLTRWLIPK